MKSFHENTAPSVLQPRSSRRREPRRSPTRSCSNLSYADINLAIDAAAPISPGWLLPRTPNGASLSANILSLDLTASVSTRVLSSTRASTRTPAPAVQVVLDQSNDVVDGGTAAPADATAPPAGASAGVARAAAVYCRYRHGLGGAGGRRRTGTVGDTAGTVGGLLATPLVGPSASTAQGRRGSRSVTRSAGPGHRETWASGRRHRLESGDAAGGAVGGATGSHPGRWVARRVASAAPWAALLSAMPPADTSTATCSTWT